MTKINRKSLQIGACLAITLVMLNIALSLSNSSSLLSEAQMVARTHEIQTELVELLTLITSSETGERGFIITGDEAYLDPYRESNNLIERQLRHIESLMDGFPEQQERLQQLRQHVASKLVELDESIRLRREIGFEAASNFVNSDRGMREMESIRGILDDLILAERQELIARDHEIARTYWTTLLSGLGSGLAALTAILGFMFFSRRYIDEREANALELSEKTERLRTTLASIGDAVITTDGRGVVTNLNLVAENLTGWTSEEARGKSLPVVFRILHESTREPVENPAIRALQFGEIVGLPNQTVLVRRDGSEIPIDDSAAPIRRKDQRVIGSIIVFRNVSTRREQERQLRKSEATFRATFDRAPIGIAHISLTGEFLRVNEKLGQILGYAPEELCGRDFEDIVNSQEYDASQRSVEKMLASSCEIYIAEWRCQRKDATVVWTNLTSSVVHDENGIAEYLLVMIEDIAEWKQAEENRIRLASIVSSSNDAIIGKTFDGTVTSWNPAAERLFGFRQTEMVGESILKIIPADRHAEELAILRQMRDGTSIAQLETTRRHKNGRILDVLLNISPIKDINGKNEGVSTIVRDVTRQRQAEASLKETQERFQMMADNISQFAWMADASGHIYWYNKRWYDYTGTTRDEMEGWGWTKVHHPEHVDRVIRRIQHSWDTGENWEDTFPLRGQDGNYRWFLSRALPIRDATGKIVTWFGTNTDITELKQYEESLHSARLAAERANNSRGEFLANMSHEIRTPMTAILGHADILAEHVRDPDNLHCVETIRRNGKFLLQIINDILDLSKIDAGRFSVDREELQPEVILADIRSLMDVRAHEKQLTFETTIQGPIPKKIETDPVRLRQILLNLVGNAFKFTDRGFVKLVASFDASHARILFEVQDTGIGIAEEDLSRLFQPFMQADASSTRAYEGTGLGLAISRRLAQALGGDIAVQSELGKGSVFTLAIDCGEVRDSDLVTPSIAISNPGDTANPAINIAGTILVVDDRRDIRFIAQHFIEKAGGVVITACNGQEAIELLTNSASGKSVDLVVMDMQMPVMDGYTAAAELRRLGYNKPIIALTANAMKDDRLKCLECGCSDYATKPLDGGRFISLVASYLQSIRQ